jgi:ABC-2 type transport system ATP-binding protein
MDRMSAPPLLELAGVSRRHGTRIALEELDLRVERGEVLALLGVNGAGKSTALRLAAGVLRPDRGVVRVDGHDHAQAPHAARSRLGYLPERPPLYADMRVADFLAFCARLRGLADVRAAVESALARCDLGEVRTRLVANLSKGFRQRVGLAQALIHDPPLLLLDEPAAGLDPVQTHRFHELILALAPERAIVLSTHQLDEARKLATRVAILHAGRLRESCAPEPATPGGETLEQRFLRVALGPAVAA